MKLAAVVLVVIGLTQVAVRTAHADTAMGAVFGYPGNVGFSWRSGPTPIGVAWSGDFIHGTADMWLKKTPMKNGDGKMIWYYGPGLDIGIPLKDSEDFFLAGRVPFGIQYMSSPKLELFGELAPGIQVLHDFDFYWAGSVGIRFVLGK